jgi:hypothetical protein
MPSLPKLWRWKEFVNLLEVRRDYGTSHLGLRGGGLAVLVTGYDGAYTVVVPGT